MPVAPPRERRVMRVVGTVYAIAAFIPPALLVAYLVGSLLFTGAQVSDADKPIWGQVWHYPVFTMPTPVLIVPAVIALTLAVVLATLAQRDDVPRLRGSVGVTVAAALSSAGFAALVPWNRVRAGDWWYGDQWIAGAIYALALVAILIGTAIAGSRPAHSDPNSRGAIT